MPTLAGAKCRNCHVIPGCSFPIEPQKSRKSHELYGYFKTTVLPQRYFESETTQWQSCGPRGWSVSLKKPTELSSTEGFFFPLLSFAKHQNTVQLSYFLDFKKSRNFHCCCFRKESPNIKRYKDYCLMCQISTGQSLKR